MLTAPRYTVTVRTFGGGGGGIMLCRRTRIALAGVVSLLLLALLGGAGDAFAQGTTDYDTNNNGLIDITTLAQLDAIRHDLDGNGDATHADYVAAFPNRVTSAAGRMGCPDGTCTGYELRADLDFDTGEAGVRTDDTYYNDGAGWAPIGTYTAAFQGNGHTIANLFINSTGTGEVGLFGGADGGVIEGVALTDVDIRASYANSGATYHYLSVGALGGLITGTVRASSATGEITTTASGQVSSRVGGLAGDVAGLTTIANSYAAVDVTANSTAPATTLLSDRDAVGGLLGTIFGSGTASAMTATYATGDVTAQRGGAAAGGLTGLAYLSNVTASYATGTVTGAAGGDTGGLIGVIQAGAMVTASYWDTDTSGINDDGDDDAPEGKTTVELQTPTAYGSATSTPPSIYASWNVDVDGENGADDPWDFGTNTQYPMLKHERPDIPEPVGPGEPVAVEAAPIIYNLNIRFDARRIALPEGHTASYRVRLAGPPSGSSKISIRSDNPDVTPSPAELTFTAANWNQWQTVQISVAGDPNHTDESATLAHYGPNRGYGSVLVSVTDTGDSRQAGDTPPPALTVVTEPGARWGVTVTPTVPADLAAHGVVRVSSAYGAPRTATGYSLGRNGVAQAIVSIAGPADVPASGLTVCLPVARALVDEAGERLLTLLRYADGWQPVSGAEHNAATRSVCAAGVTDFGPFAAAYLLP